MPTISMFRGIKITMYWSDHMPPHFHATYGGEEVIVSIKDLDSSQQTAENAAWLGSHPAGSADGQLGACGQKTGTLCDRATEISPEPGPERMCDHGKKRGILFV